MSNNAAIEEAGKILDEAIDKMFALGLPPVEIKNLLVACSLEVDKLYPSKVLN